MSIEHSPLPWSTDPDDDETRVMDARSVPVATVFGGAVRVSQMDRLPSMRRETAEFIVRACNAHADLASALRLLVGYLRKYERWPVKSEHSIYLEVAERALRQAEEAVQA